MNPSTTTSELLSALADDQLDDAEFAAALDACGHDESALDRWNTYHLIGDLLRSPAVGLPTSVAVGAELAFASRLSKRLAQEPPIEALRVAVKPVPAASLPPVASPVHHWSPASNDGNFRWKLVAGVASLAAVSAIAWNASGLLMPGSVSQLAQVFSPQIVVTSSQGPVLRDARLEELLAAHRQFGATSALQEPSGFLRNATFEMPRDAQSAGGR